MSKDGSVDWCCFHRFDARPVFARLLDWTKGGHFRVAPVGDYRVTRAYEPNTNILRTTFETGSGVLSLIDCMPIKDDETDVHAHHQLLRLAKCEQGEVDVTVEFEPRFDFGMTAPHVKLLDNHLVEVTGGADALVLQSEISLNAKGLSECEGRAMLGAGEEMAMALTFILPHDLDPNPMDPDEIRRRVESTREFWQQWSGTCTYEGPYKEQVIRSALVLKALTDATTGAIVAAPTTSLPELIGGERNWDYRFTWLRDAALNLYSLFQLGYSGEAKDFMEWLQRTTAGRVEDLQPVYGVGGERMLPEIEWSELEGYRGSTPVRTGNLASEQFQLDIYGELMDTAWLYHRHGGKIDREFWEFLCGIVDQVAERWTEPDEGVWEVRDARHHFVSSKVLAWVAVDRGLRLAEEVGLPAGPGWESLRSEIRLTIETDGVDPATGAFIRAFGDSRADASNLLIPLVGFLPGDDPRVRATVAAVEEELTTNGLVDRYRGEDGLPGGEGAFVVCSFWLAGNLAMIGERTRAQELFEQLLEYANDVGLLSEQIDPLSRDFLGNFPQAFSHAALISAALHLSDSE